MQNTDQSVSHTSGPWHVEKSCGRYEIWPKDNGEPHTFVGIAQTEANARLIAAAPDLLAACKAACESLCCIADGAGDCPDWNEGGEYYEATEALKAAIAKAQGRDV